MEIEKILGRHSPLQENLLNILHDVQDAHPRKYLPEPHIRKVAEYLDTNLAQLYGVVKYYTMFSTEPRARYIIRICRSPVCHIMDGKTLPELLEKVLGTGINEPTPDGLFYVEYSECLGICSIAPAMMVGDQIYGQLTEKGIEKLISLIRDEENQKG